VTVKRQCRYILQRRVGASVLIAFAKIAARICFTIKPTEAGNAFSTSASLSSYVINSRAQLSSSLSIWCKKSLRLTEFAIAACASRLAISLIVFQKFLYDRNKKKNDAEITLEVHAASINTDQAWSNAEDNLHLRIILSGF